MQDPIIPDDNDDNINIVITNPDNSTFITELDTYIIRWQASNSILDVKIELYNGTEFAEVINNKTSNDGKSTWVMNNDIGFYLNGTNYRIKITDYYNSSICAVSDCFEIDIDYGVDDKGDNENGNGC